MKLDNLFDAIAGSFFTVVMVAVALGTVCGSVYFYQANETGPCAGKGGVNANASYAQRYVQCGNGARIK